MYYGKPKYLPKLWLLIKFNIIGIVSAAVSAVIGIGFGVYSFGGLSQQLPDNIPLPDIPLTSTPQNVETNTSPNTSDVDQTVVNRLMNEEGLDIETATLIAQIDSEIKIQNSTYLNYEQTLEGQGAWDVQIRAIPDQTYIPTEAELQAAAATGREIYDVSYSIEEIGGVPQFTLRYFVPYDAMSEELKVSIQSNAGLSASATAVGFLPSAEASGGATGAVIVTIIKNLIKEGADKLSDAGKIPNLGNLFGALDAAISAYKVSESKLYFSELNQLRECAENPTNPLTKKTYQENPSEKAKVVDQVNEAQSQMEQLTAARLLNLAAKTGSKFLTQGNFAGKLFLDSVAKWNDETLKEVSEGWVDDARKAVVRCEPPEPAAIRLKGSIQYQASDSVELCPSANTCETTKQEITGSGNFFLTTTDDNRIIGNGTGTSEETKSKSHWSYGESTCVGGGVSKLFVSGDISRSSIHVTGGGVTLDCTGTQTDWRGTISGEWQEHGAGLFGCSAKDVDFVNGGTYKEDVIWEGTVVGSCKVVLTPFTDDQ